jgi:glucokinase
MQPRGFTLSPRPVLALDLGGTQIRAAVIQPDGTRLGRVAVPTPTDDGPRAVVIACAEALERSRGAAVSEGVDDLVGIGISAPGPVDPRAGVVSEPPNLGPDFRDVPLADDIESSLRLPTFLDRDTNVAALGEATYGAGRGYRDFIYLTVSTGVGGAIFADGRLFHGPDGMAGELGHVPVDIDGPRCGCGAVGHLEAIASGVAIARDATAAVRSGESPFLVSQARIMGPEDLSAKDVAAGEEHGDQTCSRIMDRARRAIAAACVGFVNTFNPRRIIIGGAIAEAQGERLRGLVAEALVREGFGRLVAGVDVVAPELGPDVSLAGAHPLVTARLGDPAWRRSTNRSIHAASA